MSSRLSADNNQEIVLGGRQGIQPSHRSELRQCTIENNIGFISSQSISNHKEDTHDSMVITSVRSALPPHDHTCFWGGFTQQLCYLLRCFRLRLQHDEGSNCGTLGSRGGKGRYLMFPQATEEVRENNERFSPCSIKHISMTLRLKKDDCFVGERGTERRLCVLVQAHCTVVGTILTFAS